MTPAPPTAPAPPDAPPSRFARARAAAAAPFVAAMREVARQPLWFRAGFVLVLAVGSVAGAVYASVHLKKRDAVHATASAWGAYTAAAQRADLDGMRAALAAAAAANPADPTPARYREMIDRGSADADAPELAAVLMAHHRAAERLPEAAREAEKVLATYPKNWLARCYVAHHALQDLRDPAAAERELALLPDPEDPAAGVRLNGVLYALRLFDATGRDATGLRAVALRKLVPLTRTAAAAAAPAAAKVQLVTCYLEPFADPAAVPELAGYWAAVDRLAEDAVGEATAAGDTRTLARVAELGPRLRVALALIRAADPARLPPDRFKSLVAAVDNRTRRAWLAVREKEPQRPEAYRGLAVLALQAGDPAAAVQHLVDGLAACGDRPVLLEQLVALVARYGTDAATRALADRMWKSAETGKPSPVRWCLAAETALVVGRPDAALVACRRARAADPRHPWACGTEARIHARAGNFFDAREALAALGEPAVLASPALVRLHARVIVGTGLWLLRDDEFKKAAAAPGKNRAAAVAFLRGVLDAPPDADRSAWVAATAELVLATDPDAGGAAAARADALFRLAELSAAPHAEDRSKPPVWNPARVAAALRAINQLPPEQRATQDAIAAVATLQLKGEGSAAAALRTVAPLLAAEATAAPAHLEVVGTVLLASGRAAEAVRLLERAARGPGATAGCVVALATAYERNHQPIEARAALTRAEAMPNRSGREQAELIATKLTLLKETP
ncbi:tetratricopeptide repeat protein [Gemmata sp.]|uniref:tetratricopeptide repeat protein n=1 Tax=Gemmata sp. TaxID=1914242 RepID=UPI003F720DF4